MECKKCQMPLDDKTTCSCQPDTCVHCCECGEGCACDCGKKAVVAE